MILGISAFLSWGAAVVVGIAGLVVGGFVVKMLSRHRVPWWPATIAPAATFGPALGLLTFAFLRAFDVEEAPWPIESILFWRPECGGAARTGWSLLLFFGAVGAYGLVMRFLTSRVVAEELGLRIPEVFVDLGRILLWGVMAIVVVVVIWQKQEWVTGLFAAGAATTLVVGLALQDTLKNFISAWAIVGEGVYTIGDWIWVGEDEGEVVSVTRRTTKIRTRSGDIVTIPNAQVTSSKVRNESRPTAAHAEYVTIQAASDAPPNRVRDVLRRAVLETPRILQTPAPKFRVKNFADSGVDYQVKVWIDAIADLPDILSDLRVHIWYQFQREGIEIPYPVREVRRHLAPVADPEARSKTILARLKSVPFFDALPEELLIVLSRDAGLAEYGAGERVVVQGEAGDTAYAVDRGTLAVLVSDGATDHQVATLHAGDFFGEMSLLTGEPRAASVRVLDDARLVAVGSSSLRTALERSPDLAHRLAEAVALRKEGLLEARAALDVAARARVDASAYRLRELIKRFFRLPEQPVPAGASKPPAPAAAGGDASVAGVPPPP